MKTIISRVKNGLVVGLILLGNMVHAQSTDPGSVGVVNKQPFEVGTYMGTGRTVNLILMIREAEWVTLTVKDAHNTVLSIQHLKKSSKAYHQKVNFEGSQPGSYRLEVSDGRQTVVRRIDVVDIPAIESQRYITFYSQTVH